MNCLRVVGLCHSEYFPPPSVPEDEALDVAHHFELLCRFLRMHARHGNGIQGASYISTRFLAVSRANSFIPRSKMDQALLIHHLFTAFAMVIMACRLLCRRFMFGKFNFGG
jgi:hypothetical protein